MHCTLLSTPRTAIVKDTMPSPVEIRSNSQYQAGSVVATPDVSISKNCEETHVQKSFQALDATSGPSRSPKRSVGFEDLPKMCLTWDEQESQVISEKISKRVKTPRGNVQPPSFNAKNSHTEISRSAKLNETQ